MQYPIIISSNVVNYISFIPSLCKYLVSDSKPRHKHKKQDKMMNTTESVLTSDTFQLNEIETNKLIKNNVISDVVNICCYLFMF